jgi:hypothetical protein
MHVRYSILSDCAFSPNWSCGSFVVIFGVLFGSPHMAFWKSTYDFLEGNDLLVKFGYVWHGVCYGIKAISNS